MKRTLLLALLALGTPSFGALEIGEQAPPLCYSDMDLNNVCTNQMMGAVTVLIYSTGWCPACNDEMRELVPRLGELKGEPVVFISLSSQGFSHGSNPDAEFLKQWKAKHNIPFTVAASPKDAGKAFFDPPYYIPATVILDKSGKLAAKEQGMSVDDLIATVKRLL